MKRTRCIFFSWLIFLGSFAGRGEAAGRARDERSFPEPGSKKGLQVQMIEDGLTLGIKHATLNVSLGSLIDLEHHASNPTWELEGQKFSFNRSYVERLGVKQLSDAGVNVYLILLGYQTGNAAVNEALLHPKRAAKLPNGIAAINTVTPEGARLWRATMEFLADRFCRPGDEHGRVVGFIIGNEVNVHHEWHNLGQMPPPDAVADYLRQVRLAHEALRKFSAHARVYLSMTHHWTAAPLKNPEDAMPGRVFLDLFNAQARETGDFDWHVAHHPYPEDLGNPRTWEDRTALPSFDSPRITFKNLEQLQAYLGQREFLWEGKRRSIILSEQGFHSSGSAEGKRGEQAQAAGFCYAWEKIAQLEGIHAFILHRHVDHQHEGGLNLGLWRRKKDSVATPDTQKPIYACFKAAGTAEQEKAFAFALPVVGLKSWEELKARAEAR